MKIYVDYEQCQGHARCGQTAPTLFEFDEQGKSRPVQTAVPDDLVDAAELAVLSCPERAISLREQS